MKHHSLLSILAFSTLTVVAIPTNVFAEDAVSDFEVSANVGFVSEYSFRGIKQSDEHPAIQGGFDVGHSSGLYAGVWASNVDFDDGDKTSMEVDVYAGYAGSFKGVSYDIGAIYYAYPGADSSDNYDFVEGAVSVGYDFDVAAVAASVNYSPEYFGDSGDAFYYALGVDVPLPADLSLSAHVGRQSIDDNTAFGVPDYTDWSLGLGYNYKGFDLSVAYIDTDLNSTECADGCDSKVIFGVSRSF